MKIKINFIGVKKIEGDDYIYCYTKIKGDSKLKIESKKLSDWENKTFNANNFNDLLLYQLYKDKQLLIFEIDTNNNITSLEVCNE